VVIDTDPANAPFGKAIGLPRQRVLLHGPSEGWFTEANTVQRIAVQISTSTPDKPVLLIEIRTDQCRALERAIRALECISALPIRNLIDKLGSI
jgi:hypothetical protein